MFLDDFQPVCHLHVSTMLYSVSLRVLIAFRVDWISKRLA